MNAIDLNSDVGESYGAYTIGNDDKIMPYISSANIACGFHAGDAHVMKETVSRALEHSVAIGAHPGLPDIGGFGRRKIDISPQEGYELVVYQIGALWAIAKAQGGKLHHVKPHGALYNMAAADQALAEAIANAVYDVDPNLVFYGLAGSALIAAGKKVGLKTASEVFADRTYQADGSLTSRRVPNALITDPKEASAQVLRMIQEGKVRTQQGTDVEIDAQTVCIHGDGAHAVAFAEELKGELERHGIAVKAGNS
ncbi:LamB/YcsF family protein [Shouchella clausii]|uniref:LamB/YcsF family protein n=1 Tax=Shouchella clausii TaxID=79880 RepID=UPI0021480112|nr:5-oxoprolinase subunit PxpA [Shouchella clausii]MCR1287010.1 LamB/YcsF family protein [Shouchella clausii]